MEAQSNVSNSRASAKNDKNKEWEVEKILAVRKKWKSLYVRAAWVGHDEDPEWYPISDFKTSPHLLMDFYRENPSTTGPPVQLPEWKDAYEAGREDYEHLDSNKPMNPRSRAKYFKELLEGLWEYLRRKQVLIEDLLVKYSSSELFYDRTFHLRGNLSAFDKY